MKKIGGKGVLGQDRGAKEGDLGGWAKESFDEKKKRNNPLGSTK